MPTGGDIIEITYNHPTLGSGVFLPKSGEDSTYDLGGIRSADDAAMIDGGGRIMDQLNRVRWSFEVAISAGPGDGTQEIVTALTASPETADWTITSINGKVYAGNGKPVGDQTSNGNTSQMTLKLSGGGVLKVL
jgi:hypothetical protein